MVPEILIKVRWGESIIFRPNLLTTNSKKNNGTFQEWFYKILEPEMERIWIIFFLTQILGEAA